MSPLNGLLAGDKFIVTELLFWYHERKFFILTCHINKPKYNNTNLIPDWLVPRLTTNTNSAVYKESTSGNQAAFKNQRENRKLKSIGLRI